MNSLTFKPDNLDIVIDKANKVKDKGSLNHLLYFLLHHNIDIVKIKLNPVLSCDVSGTAIANICRKNSFIYIDVNIFKIKIFAHLESLYITYLKNEDIASLEILKYSTQLLLYRYTFGSNELYRLMNKNIYIQKNIIDPPINRIIDILYKKLKESYCVCINYNKIFNYK